MGNHVSSSETPFKTSPQPQKKSGVNAFHSTKQWKAHFDAAKGSDKLMVIDFTATWCGPCRFMQPIIDNFAAEYTEVEFIKIDVDELPMVIDFTATWCGPCRFMQPIIDNFAAEYTEVEFIKIDVDELPDVASEFGVQAMPAFILIKKGKQIDKVVGAKKEELRKKIEKHVS